MRLHVSTTSEDQSKVIAFEKRLSFTNTSVFDNTIETLLTATLWICRINYYCSWHALPGPHFSPVKLMLSNLAMFGPRLVCASLLAMSIISCHLVSFTPANTK